MYEMRKENEMYEKLEKLRGEVKRLRTRVEDDQNRLKAAEEKLKKAENDQILSDVSAMNLGPEQLAQFLKLMSQGQLENLLSSTSQLDEENVSKVETVADTYQDAEDEIFYGNRKDEDLEDE